jgi:alginate O-acetyltransferase complex protein AlgJ
MRERDFPGSLSAMPLGRRAILGGMAAGAFALAAGRPAHAEIEGLVVVGSDGWLYPIWDEVRRFDAPRFATTTKLVVDACNILKKAGIQVVISLTPSKSRIYREYLPKDFAWTAETDKRYAAALDALGKGGVLVPDLATLFLNARKANPTVEYFFHTDTHWTPTGAELAAGEIARQVQAKIKLPPSSQPGKKLGDYIKMIQAKNDLSEQLPPADKAKYGKEFYQIRNDADQGGGALLEDDTADTVLIGNSYTQPKYQYADYLSVDLNRPVGLTWHVHQYGSYAILLEYLGSKAFKTTRPKLIVWDFEETDMEGPPDRKDFWGEHAMPNEQFLSQLTKAVS